MMQLRNILMGALLCFAVNANAQGVTVAGSMSTLGPGVHVSVPYNDVVNFRLFLAGYRYTTDDDLSGNNYDVKYTLSGVGALADWHPFGSGFHVSLGMFRTSNRLDALSQATAEYSIGENLYSAAEVRGMRVKADLGAGAPYAGMGWGFAIDGSGLGFEVEAGTIFQGKPKAVVYVEPGPSLSGSLSASQAARLTQLQNDRLLEEEDVRGGFDSFKAFPFITIGATYAFK